MGKPFCVLGILIGIGIIVFGAISFYDNNKSLKSFDTAENYANTKELTSTRFNADYYTYEYKATRAAALEANQIYRIVAQGKRAVIEADRRFSAFLIFFGGVIICSFAVALSVISSKEKIHTAPASLSYASPAQPINTAPTINNQNINVKIDFSFDKDMKDLCKGVVGYYDPLFLHISCPKPANINYTITYPGGYKETDIGKLKPGFASVIGWEDGIANYLRDIDINATMGILKIDYRLDNGETGSSSIIIEKSTKKPDVFRFVFTTDPDEMEKSKKAVKMEEPLYLNVVNLSSLKELNMECIFSFPNEKAVKKTIKIPVSSHKSFCWKKGIGSYMEELGAKATGGILKIDYELDNGETGNTSIEIVG